MNRRITFYYTFLLIIATMSSALGNTLNIDATSTFSGLSTGTLNSNLNGTLNTLTPFNDGADNKEPNNPKDCAKCIVTDDIKPGIAAPIISNDNDGGNDNGDASGGNDNDGGNDNPNENDFLGDLPFSLPFNSQFADPSDDAIGDVNDIIPFP